MLMPYGDECSKAATAVPVGWRRRRRTHTTTSEPLNITSTYRGNGIRKLSSPLEEAPLLRLLLKTRRRSPPLVGSSSSGLRHDAQQERWSFHHYPLTRIDAQLLQ